MKTKTNVKTKLVSFLLKSILTLVLVIGVFLLWGMFNKAEAAGAEIMLNG